MEVQVATFNVRVDTPVDDPGGNRWEHRKKAAVETISRIAPDVLGVQEALDHQFNDLLEGLPEYRAAGRARDIRGTGERVPLFWIDERFNLERNGQFWLSATPEEEGSIGWDASITRISTWAVLESTFDKRMVAILNTHLDHMGRKARIESANLIADRLTQFEGVPSVVMGDLNALPDSETLEALRDAGLRDVFAEAQPDAKQEGTVHHYTGEASRRIDFILCDDSFEVLGAELIKDRIDGRYPSDHFPVTARLKLKD